MSERTTVMRSRSGDLAPESGVRVGYFSTEELRQAGLSSVFAEPLESDSVCVEPVSETLQNLLEDRRLRFLLLDLNGWEQKRSVLEMIHRTRPDLNLLVIGPDEEELALAALHLGAKAYIDLTASVELVRRAILTVAGGSIWASRYLLAKLLDRMLEANRRSRVKQAVQLTLRESQVLELILAARSNREIAEQLGIEERTVKAHVGRLMRKTGVENRVELSMRVLDKMIQVTPQIMERQETPLKSRDRQRNAAGFSN